AVVRGAKRGIQRVIAKPIRLALDEREERARARRVRRQLSLAKAGERLGKDPTLEGAYGSVIDGGRPPNALELRGPVRAERALDELGVDVGDRLDVEVDRIEGKCGQRSVGARLPLGELMRRQDLEEGLPRAKKEASTR